MTEYVQRPFIYRPPAEPFLDIIHVDDDILVLNKPSGLLTVAGVDPALTDCLEARAVSQYPGAGMIHRLDLDTSGIIVLARNKRAHGRIGIQFEKRQTVKTYIARVFGSVTGDEGTIDLPLATDWPNRPRQRVDHERGRPSQTNWRVLAREPEATRLALTPLTGRSHQLRVHLLAIGHPILGDALYAPDAAFAAANRLQLHAETLAFTHPTSGEPVSFSVPCPF